MKTPFTTVHRNMNLELATDTIRPCSETFSRSLTNQRYNLLSNLSKTWKKGNQIDWNNLPQTFYVCI